MNNPLQEQLLKTGLVSKKQAHKAKQEKSKKNKQKHSKNEKNIEEVTLKAQLAVEEKSKRDRELNKRKEEQARKKAISIEINQLIKSNCLDRDEGCDIVYHFEHNSRINRIYINAEMKQQIISGELVIARIEGQYELVSETIAEKIRKRNEKRIVIFDDKEVCSDDGYLSSEYQVPDDLMW